MNDEKTFESNWAGEGIPELQTDRSELPEIIELVPPRVKVDLKRYDELIRKETILSILARCLFAENLYFHEKEYRVILGEYSPAVPKENADE